MTLRGILLGSILILIVMGMDAPSGSCSLARCHDAKCSHFLDTFHHHWLIQWCDSVTDRTVLGPKRLGAQIGSTSSGSTYRQANYLVYFIALPILGLLGAWLRREPKWLYGLAAVAFTTVIFLVGLFKSVMGHRACIAIQQNFAYDSVI